MKIRTLASLALILTLSGCSTVKDLLYSDAYSADQMEQLATHKAAVIIAEAKGEEAPEAPVIIPESKPSIIADVIESAAESSGVPFLGDLVGYAIAAGATGLGLRELKQKKSLKSIVGILTDSIDGHAEKHPKDTPELKKSVKKNMQDAGLNGELRKIRKQEV